MVRPLFSLARRVLDEACGVRSGLLPPWQWVEPTAADLPGFHNVFIVGDSESTKEASAGGLGRRLPDAVAAAIGESLERYCASQVSLPRRQSADVAAADRLSFQLFSPAQRAASDFPWPDSDGPGLWLAPVFRLRDQACRWAPESLVGLGPRAGVAQLPSFSSGLAAHTDRSQALLNATLELLERDALAVSWVQSLSAPLTPLGAQDLESVHALGGSVEARVLTQAWNPCPVVAVAGQLPLRGVPRFAFGVACRPSLAEATERAYLEWVQGVVFAGYQLADQPTLRLPDPLDLTDFVDHSAFWARHPALWQDAPLRASATVVTKASSLVGTAAMQLEALMHALHRSGIDLYYRDLTLPDVAALGVTVVRVLSPDLVPLHCDERWPFLCASDRGRYPDQAFGRRNPLPHPLG